MEAEIVGKQSKLADVYKQLESACQAELRQCKKGGGGSDGAEGGEGAEGGGGGGGGGRGGLLSFVARIARYFQLAAVLVRQ